MKVRVLPCPGVSHALCAHDKVTTALPSPTYGDGNAMLAREIRQWGNMRHQSAAESGVKQLRRTGSCPPAAACPWVKVKAAGRDTEAAAAGAGCYTAALCLANRYSADISIWGVSPSHVNGTEHLHSPPVWGLDKSMNTAFTMCQDQAAEVVPPYQGSAKISRSVATNRLLTI